MTTRRSFPRLALCAASLACASGEVRPDPAPPLGGQTGEENGPGCTTVERRTLAWSERSPLGFGAGELLAALGSQRSATLLWQDGSSTRLALGLERAEGDVLFEQRTPEVDGTGREIAVAECRDTLLVPVTVSFVTADGAFAEAWRARLNAEGPELATASFPVDLEGLAGTFTVTQVDTDAYDEVLAFATLRFGAEAWSGSLSGQATQSTGAGPDDTTSVLGFEIASY